MTRRRLVFTAVVLCAAVGCSGASDAGVSGTAHGTISTGTEHGAHEHCAVVRAADLGCGLPQWRGRPRQRGRHDPAPRRQRSPVSRRGPNACRRPRRDGSSCHPDRFRSPSMPFCSCPHEHRSSPKPAMSGRVHGAPPRMCLGRIPRRPRRARGVWRPIRVIPALFRTWSWVPEPAVIVVRNHDPLHHDEDRRAS